MKKQEISNINLYVMSNINSIFLNFYELLSTYNILNNWNSGAENKLNSQIEKLNKKVEKNKNDLKKDNLKENRIKKINESIQTLTKEKEKLQQEYLSSSEYRSDIDKKVKEMYIDDLYTVVQSQVT
ncbi:MAG: hypothetical protein ACLRH5_07645 [Intestinibacter bartlettii]|uniref:hypothetical protein n=1 Tax=Intestinibacter bartlettii TaxID=261299 RepID=UPI0039A2D21A